MVRIGKKEKSDKLYQAILQLKDPQECYDFFQDLCTVSELRSMEQRFEVASLLNDGMIYSDILEQTGASSATISRVNRSLSYGTGAYERVFARMKELEAVSYTHLLGLCRRVRQRQALEGHLRHGAGGGDPLLRSCDQRCDLLFPERMGRLGRLGLQSGL